MPQCARPGCEGYRDPKDGQKLCDCCRCKGCGACEELTEQDKRLVEESPKLSWLHCGGVRSGAPRCPHRKQKPNILLKRKIHYCHRCLSAQTQKREPKPKPDDQAAAAPPPTADIVDPTADIVDGLLMLNDVVFAQTGKALPDGWHALLPRHAVRDAMQTGEFISPEGKRFRTMQCVAQHVGQQRTCAAQHEVAAASTPCSRLAPLLSMESPPEHAAPAAASFGGARARGA